MPPIAQYPLVIPPVGCTLCKLVEGSMVLLTESKTFIVAGTERDALDRLKDIDVDIVSFWIPVKLTRSERQLISANAIFDGRTFSGETAQYLCHLIYVSRPLEQPAEDLGIPGDVWVGPTSIYWFNTDGWQEWSCENVANPRYPWSTPSNLPQHPFLPSKYLWLNCSRLSLCWMAPTSIRGNRTQKWNLRTFRSIPELRKSTVRWSEHALVEYMLQQESDDFTILQLAGFYQYLIRIYHDELAEPRAPHDLPEVLSAEVSNLICKY